MHPACTRRKSSDRPAGVLSPICSDGVPRRLVWPHASASSANSGDTPRFGHRGLSHLADIIEHVVDPAQIEYVAPSLIATGNILFLAHAYDSEWGLVTEITEHVPNTRCTADVDSNPNHVHAFDAYHFTCDVWSQDSKLRGCSVVCEPTAAAEGGRTYLNHRVGRSIQK
jgi:hypothetical protein